MESVLRWPGLWYGILFAPEKTAEHLKKHKPGLIDGVASIGLCSIVIGIVSFIVLAVLSIVFASLMPYSFGSAGLLGVGVGLAMAFALLVIGFPLGMIILLLIIACFIKLASVLLKGRGKFSEECGIVGVVGSPYLILMFLLLVAIYLPLILLSAVGFGGGLASIALIYLFMGLAYLVFMPFMQLLMAFFFDLLADIEQVSIYRSGAMTGLVFGAMLFIMMLAFAILIFLLGGAVSSLGRMSGQYY